MAAMSSDDNRPVATTSSGRVSGQRRADLVSFLGIPFAAPPVGAHRFRPPVVPEPWEGTRPCIKRGPVCPQHDMRAEFVVPVPLPEPWELGREGDDCLNLNIWTPGLDDAARPVLFWVHGGAFVIGSGATPLYDGAALAREGAVVVTVNYRLGAFGYLHLDPLCGEEHAGNLGQLDQIAALRWVQENIAAFGGDPGRVTIFGESGGGMAVGTLLAMPGGRGLFHRAIAQSGAAHHTLPTDVAATIAKRFCELVSLDPTDRDALERLPAERIVEATLELRKATLADPVAELGENDAHLSMPFMPVHDTFDLPTAAIDAIAAGSAAGVDVVVGSTRDESKAFMFGQPPGEVPEQYRALARSRGRDPETLAAAYGKILGERAAMELRGTVSTDGFFAVPAIRLAEAQQRHHARTWMYRFDWASPLFGGLLGACHGLDIGFTFGTHRMPDNFLAGNDPPDELSDQMRAAWVAFASGGDPNHPGIPHADPYEPTRRQTLLLDTPCRVVDDPEPERRQVWDGLL
jgi:para-nitrobenzyl esterase